MSTTDLVNRTMGLCLEASEYYKCVLNNKTWCFSDDRMNCNCFREIMWIPFLDLIRLWDHFIINAVIKYNFSWYLGTQTRALGVNGCQLYKHAAQVPNSSHPDIHWNVQVWKYILLWVYRGLSESSLLYKHCINVMMSVLTWLYKFTFISNIVIHEFFELCISRIWMIHLI